MRVWIVCCGTKESERRGRCTAAEFEALTEALAEGEPPAFPDRPMKASGLPVYLAPGRCARLTAAQILPHALPREEPRLAPIAQRAYRETDALHTVRFWRTMARLQAMRGDARQPESRRASAARAEALVGELEEKGDDCCLVTDAGFLPFLLDAFRRRGCSMARSGIGRFRPWERIQITKRESHCGGCAHNCLLSNPGCGVGKDKARRLRGGYRA